MRAGFAIVALAGVFTNALANDIPVEEYRVKGAFLLNFTKFVQWPEPAFKAPSDPIAICILGPSPFTPEFEQAARDLVVDKRQVAVRHIADPQSAHHCQILFVPASERKRASAVLEAIRDESVLTVGESEGFLAGGGVIELRLEERKLRMEISVPAAQRAGLRISAKLLALSQPAKK